MCGPQDYKQEHGCNRIKYIHSTEERSPLIITRGDIFLHETLRENSAFVKRGTLYRQGTARLTRALSRPPAP
jgi:hypothetical protein